MSYGNNSFRIASQERRPGSWTDASGFLYWPVVFAPACFGAMNASEFNSLIHEGQEVVAGRTCEVLVLRGNSDYRFWLDMERGANFVQWERLVKGKIIYRVHSIELLELADTQGKRLWFPVRGARDNFGAPRHESYTGKVQARLDLRILRDTVKLNTGLSASQAKVSLDRNHVILTPELKAKMRERWLKMPKEGPLPTATNTREDIARVLKEAAEQEATLHQQARPNNYFSPWSIMAILCALAGITGLLVAWRWGQKT